ADEDESEPYAEIGELRPEDVERANALGNAFGVVDAIDAHAQLASAVRVPRAQRVHPSLALRPQRHLLEAVGVDTDRERADGNLAIAECHDLLIPVDVGLIDELVDAGKEVRRVAIDLEFDEIVAVQPT